MSNLILFFKRRLFSRSLSIGTQSSMQGESARSVKGWHNIKETLIASVGSGSIPTIKVEDADFGRNHTLYMKHYHDGRDLQLEYAEHTLKHVKALWERDVVLETIVNGKKSILKLVGDSLKVERG